VSDIDNDKNGRKDWEKTYVDGLKLMGLQIEERTEPWNGACGVFHPMITEAVVRFQARQSLRRSLPKGLCAANHWQRNARDERESRPTSKTT
jgi:hypothetical protein